MPHAMPQIQTPPPEPAEVPGGLYDHESDAGLGLGERRRAVADWGADDLFHRRERGGRGRFARDERIDAGEDAPPATVTAIETARSYVPAEEAPAPAPVVTAPAPRRAASSRRPRSARTVNQRIGHRPDRIAAWAVGLGIGLILIAVGTADAAPL